MPMTRIRILMLAATVAASFACRDPAPTASDAIGGDWRGTIVDSDAGTGSVSVSLTESGAGLSGTWSDTFADTSKNRRGTASGTIAAGTVSLFLTPDASIACASGATFSGTLGATLTLRAGRLAGAYTVF